MCEGWNADLGAKARIGSDWFGVPVSERPSLNASPLFKFSLIMHENA
jgi:hypothetical protein